MDADDILLDAEERMEKAVEVLKGNLAGIRTGRANPGLVDSLRADVYGNPTPIKQVATVSVPEATQIIIRPYDANTSKEIEKAIIASDLGLNPQNDGRVIRINIPPLSGEVRRKLVSRTKDLAEEAKISIRNIRRDSNKAADQAEKSKELSEDKRDHVKDEVQNLTKKFESRVNGLSKNRERDIMDD